MWSWNQGWRARFRRDGVLGGFRLCLRQGIGDWQGKIGARQMMSHRTEDDISPPPPFIYARRVLPPKDELGSVPAVCMSME